jgi:hypothetical protein
MDTPSTIDPYNIPSVMLTQTELDDVERRIEAGELPEDWFARYARAIEDNVFGVGHGKDANGKPIENGLGSAANQTAQSVEAYRRWGVNDIDYEKNLARIEKELAVCEARRAEERAAASPRRFGRR